MRRVFEWLVINAFLVALNLIAAGVMLAVGTALNLIPWLSESRIAWLIAGLIGVAVALLCARWVMARRLG